ncbi:VanZ like family protein [Klenkia soli]|uniref:VanZ like family protein n=1 Tax=Klenkia soli TaxID=1052260 RepID=A0A1H0INV1_9ACTN|nr:VanZ family protein [Klenkia soli]SDO33055.1 VanZ like family protein [Klenkia soli]
MTERPKGRGSVLLACLAAIALITLLPRGTGWAWADPASEIAWYLHNPWGPTAFTQWFGNLVLLTVPAALATVWWPGRVRLVVGVAALTAVAIETLQRLLPLGRVVSVVDVGLNVVGAVLVVIGVLAIRALRRGGWGRLTV